MPLLNDIRQVGLRPWVYGRSGLWLEESIADLRDQQEDVLEWAADRPEQYLFVNAPTGSGKTLLNLVYGLDVGGPLTYAVHTIRLQEQVAATLPGLPVLTGRANHPCLVGRRTHGMDITAQHGVCTMRQSCSYRDGDYLDGVYTQCPYYEQLDVALAAAVGRITNYAMYLAVPPVRYANGASSGTRVLLADEAHNVETALTSATEVTITEGMLRAVHYGWPREARSRYIAIWRGWALGLFRRIDKDDPRPVAQDALNAAKMMAAIKPENYGRWVVSFDGHTMRARPLWGRDYTMERLLGRNKNNTFVGTTGIRGLFTSATLMGAEYIAEMLGLPDDEWAYLDLPSTFPVENRPINYAPVETMNQQNMSSVEGRAPMQAAIDALVSRYVVAGHPWGLIHTVSKRYRDQLLTESRWRAIMVTESGDHEARVAAKQPSILVSPSVTEGWDGVDNLCRFIIMPKVPFADLSDPWTQERKAVDNRTYDHQAIVSVVQGAGRGVRHRKDWCDTWILDGAWGNLYRRHKDWLPRAFLDAYHHHVSLEAE